MVNKNIILQGDCIKLMKKIPDKSIDMILCDLPYGTTACKWDIIIPFDLLWEQYKRIIKDNGAIVLTGAEPFSSYLRLSNIKDYKYDWKYRKQQGTGFLNAKKQPLRDSEDICVFYKKQPAYNPQMRYTGITRKGIIKAKEKNLDDYVYRKGIIGKTAYKDNGYKYPLTTLENLYDKNRFDSSKEKRKDRHPTQKPVALFEYLIKTYTNEGDIVLDNCAGSGTTAIACINTNRNYFLMEKDEAYFEIIKNRIEEHINQISLF